MSGAVFTANNFIINHFSICVSDLVLVRTVIQALIYGSVCVYRKEVFLPGDSRQKILVIGQGIMASTTFITALASVSMMPVPDALCIIFANPIVTIILSSVMLRDKLNISKILSGFLLVTGIILVCKPPFIFSVDDQLNNILDMFGLVDEEVNKSIIQR